MIQPRPLKNLLGEGSDLAKSPLTAACTTVCKKASTDWIFPCRRRSIFLQRSSHSSPRIHGGGELLPLILGGGGRGWEGGRGTPRGGTRVHVGVRFLKISFG